MHIILLQRCYWKTMGRRLMYGVLGSYCIFSSVVCHRSGQVSTTITSDVIHLTIICFWQLLLMNLSGKNPCRNGERYIWCNITRVHWFRKSTMAKNIPWCKEPHQKDVDKRPQAENYCCSGPWLESHIIALTIQRWSLISSVCNLLAWLVHYTDYIHRNLDLFG